MQPRLVRQFCSESSCATHPAFATKKGLILLRPSISPPCEDSRGNFCAWSGSFGRPQRRMRLSMDGYLGFTGVGDSDFLRRCYGLSAPPIVCPPAPILLCCFGVWARCMQFGLDFDVFELPCTAIIWASWQPRLARRQSLPQKARWVWDGLEFAWNDCVGAFLNLPLSIGVTCPNCKCHPPPDGLRFPMYVFCLW